MSDFIISSFYEKMADVKFDAYGILDSANKIGINRLRLWRF